MQAKNSKKISVSHISDEELITRACEGLIPQAKWNSSISR